VQADFSQVDFSEADVTRLEGKVAFVTGASAGIGEACVEALVAAGMLVAACARREDRLADISRRLLKYGRLKQKDHFLGLRCDVQQEQDIKDALAKVEVSFSLSSATMSRRSGQHARTVCSQLQSSLVLLSSLEIVRIITKDDTWYRVLDFFLQNRASCTLVGRHLSNLK
jgi:NAD(P)-dependent dehydrogenase (short-subunit alcohol dehydrogenase family)